MPDQTEPNWDECFARAAAALIELCQFPNAVYEEHRAEINELFDRMDAALLEDNPQ